MVELAVLWGLKSKTLESLLNTHQQSEFAALTQRLEAVSGEAQKTHQTLARYMKLFEESETTQEITDRLKTLNHQLATLNKEKATIEIKLKQLDAVAADPKTTLDQIKAEHERVNRLSDEEKYTARARIAQQLKAIVKRITFSEGKGLIEYNHGGSGVEIQIHKKAGK